MRRRKPNGKLPNINTVDSKTLWFMQRKLSQEIDNYMWHYRCTKNEIWKKLAIQTRLNLCLVRLKLKALK